MDLSKSWPYIVKVAERRLQNNVTERQVWEYGDDIEIMGAAGELAALRELGLPENLHTEFDKGVDFLWRGYTVDVKTTKLTPRLNYRYLQWPYFKRIIADIVVVTAVDIYTYDAMVVGYATNSEIKRAKMNYERKTPCREISMELLAPIWELMIVKDKPFDRILREREYARNQQLTT